MPASISRRGMAAVVAGLAVVGAGLGLGAAAGWGEPAVSRFAVRQPPFRPAAPGQDDGPPAPGDLRVFAAVVVADDGAFPGLVTASLLAVEAPDAQAEAGRAARSRLTDLVFDFDGRGSIVVAGGAVSPENPDGAPDPMAEAVIGGPLMRPIVKGAGEFDGVRGQVVSTLQADGTFIHEFTIER
ncbi:MAG: hypothetical protein ACKOWF_07830 [Chloroflexota bacterium]